MKAGTIAALAAALTVAVAAAPANAQWRATAWTLDFHNDTDACISLTVGAEGEPPLYRRDVWAHRWQHFDDNHTQWTIHARVYEKPDCSGRFVADLHDNVHQLRNHVSVTKEGRRYVWHREPTADAPNDRG